MGAIVQLSLSRRTRAIAATFLLAGFGIGLLLFPPAGREPPPGSANDAPPVARHRLHVLSVGVGRYAHLAGADLEFPRDDAFAIDEILKAQSGSRLYEAVDSALLTDADARRAVILAHLRATIDRLQPEDVLVLFFAGHGVLEPGTGRYYFLPHDARGEDLGATALAMADIDTLLRRARTRARAVVLLLDTCHAGALRTDFALAPPADPGAGISVAAGLFLLAASKPGEVSREHTNLSHGVFTYVLLRGFAGEADGNRDGTVSVTELFSHVAREVPRLTTGAQHPYYRVEGSDVALAAIGPLPTPSARALRPIAGNHIAVLRFDNLSQDPGTEWFGEALRMAFNTELSKVGALMVYAPELIDATARQAGADPLSSAVDLGIDRLIAGSFTVVDDRMRVDARIIAVAAGLQEGSESVEGPVHEFFDLQKKLVLRLLRRLRVRLSPTENESIEGRSNTDVDAYRLLLQSEDVFEASPPEPAGTPRLGPRSHFDVIPGEVELVRLLRRLMPLASPAAAQTDDTASAQVAIEATLQRYRAALESGDLDTLEALYAEASAERRKNQAAYLANAVGLRVEIVAIEVRMRADGAVASFTRRDHFRDKGSDREQQLEVRLTRLLQQRDGQWLIVGKP